MEISPLKIRHTLLALLAVLAIAFMQPLVFFLGGLTLLFGVGALIFRDLPPAGQDAVEDRILGWLRRARSKPSLEMEPSTNRHRPSAMPAAGPNTQKPERIRRARARSTATIQSDPTPGITPEALVREEARPEATRYHEETPPAIR
jgi:hypothetical protein